MEKLGLEDDAPDENGNVRTAQEKAVSKIYSSGYKIYTLQDSKLQSIAESVFENSDLVEYTDDYGKPLQAAITLVDNSTGNVVAMVGGLGAKTVDRGWNWATEPRQCGSATKPISDYAPALDDGVFDEIPDRIALLERYPALAAHAAALKGASLNRRSVDAGKVTDHHALIITECLPGELSADERTVYDM